MKTQNLIERATAYDTSAICPECGPVLRVDEDGCCSGCGNGAMGEGVGEIEGVMAGLVAEITRLTRELSELHGIIITHAAAMARGDDLRELDMLCESSGGHVVSRRKLLDAAADVEEALKVRCIAMTKDRHVVDAAGEGE